MCGICLALYNVPYQIFNRVRSILGVPLKINRTSCPLSMDELLSNCLSTMKQRGPTLPNGHKNLSMTCFKSSSSITEVHFFASLLHLRGIKPTPQPVGGCCNEPGLMWNGEIFDAQFPLCPDASDTSILHNELKLKFQCLTSKSLSIAAFEQQVISIFNDISGPFASIVYFPPPANQLWIVRDKLGRRSLCCIEHHTDANNNFIICSNGCYDEQTEPDENIYEVPPDGALVISLNCSPPVTPPHDDSSDCSVAFAAVKLIPWPEAAPFLSDTFWSESVPPPSTSLEYPIMTTSSNLIVHQLLEKLRTAVEIRVLAQPCNSTSVSLLFSGGLDSSILAVLMLQVLPDNWILELINVAFGNVFLKAPDRYTALATYKELLEMYPGKAKQIRLLCANITQDELLNHEHHVLTCISPQLSHIDFNIGSALYFAARGEGLEINGECFTLNKDWWYLYERENSSVNVLKQRSKPKNQSCIIKEALPNPCASCHLVQKPGCVNSSCRLCCVKNQAVTLTRCPVHSLKNKKQRDEIVIDDASRVCTASILKHCLYTGINEAEKNSFDVGISTLIRGTSLSANLSSTMHCDCCLPAKHILIRKILSPVVLVGHGADELFGGYSRYGTAALHGGMERFKEEMKSDLKRLWQRNLGRDDRCISFWGRESRYPFLDENVLNFLGSLHFSSIFSATIDKPLLRALASQLGLQASVCFKKRAIQFGSRITRVTNLDHFESHRKATGTARYVPLKRTLCVE